MEVTKNKTLQDSKLETIQNQKGETSWNEQKIVLNIQQETVHACYKFWHTEKTKRAEVKVNSFSFWPCGAACGILVPQPGIESEPPAAEIQSLNH